MGTVPQLYEKYIMYATFAILAKAAYVGAKVASAMFVPPSIHARSVELNVC